MTVKDTTTDRRTPALARAAGLIAGPPGQQGKTGVAPVLTIGSIVTLASGSPATAALVPTGPGAYALNLGLPQGNQGVPGSVAGSVTASQISDSGTSGRALVQAENISDVKSLLSLVVGDVSGALGALTGDVVTTGNSAAIAARAVSYAKIQAVSATSRLLGRKSAGAGSIEELTAADIKTILALGPGDISGLAGIASSGSASDLTSGFVPASRLPAFGGGDVSFALGGGAGTIGAGRVTNAMLAGSIAASKLVGSDIATVGTLIAGATGAGFTVNLGTSTISGTLPAANTAALTGDVTKSAGSNTTTIANAAVSYAKMQNISATSRFLGRKSAGAGSPEELSTSDAKTILGITAADIAPGTFSGAFTFTSGPTISNGLPSLALINTSAGTDLKRWVPFGNSDGSLIFGKGTDDGSGLSWDIVFGRTGTITAAHFVGDGSGLTGVTSNTFAGLTDKTSYFPGVSAHVGGSALAGLDMTNSPGWMLQNTLTVAPTAIMPTLQVQRVANYSGGSGVLPALFVADSINANVSGFQWTALFQQDNYSTDTSNNCVAFYAAERARGSGGTQAGPSWAGTFEIRDYSGGNPTQPRVTLELDNWANGTDANSERIILDIVGGKHDSAGSTPTIGYGLRIGPQNGDNSSASFKTGFRMFGNIDKPIDLTGCNASATYGRAPIIFDLSGQLESWSNDAGAASGGVPVGGMYRNGSQLMVRAV